MTNFFAVSQPVPKSIFLDAYEDTTFLAQLLVAPFGLPKDLEGLSQTNLIEDYTAIYRQWEDVLSRKIYTSKGIPDDRVAATIHRYLEVKKDTKVMEVIQAATGAMGTLLDLPSVLELPGTTMNMHDNEIISSASAAAILLEQVMNALEMAFVHDHSGITEQSPLQSLLCADVDEKICTHLEGVTIPVRMFSPGSLASTILAPVCLSADSIDALRKALTISVCREHAGGPVLLLANEWSSKQKQSVHSVDSATTKNDHITHMKTEVRFSLLQYYTMLDLFSSSVEVQRVLANHGLPLANKRFGCDGLTQLRNGALGLSVTVHPTVAFVSQLHEQSKVNRAAVNTAAVSSSSGCDGRTIDDDDNNINLSDAALQRLAQAYQGRKDAMDAAAIGDTTAALRVLTKTIRGKYRGGDGGVGDDDDDNDDDDDDDDGNDDAEENQSTELPLPVFVHTKLLLDRARLRMEAAKEQSESAERTRAFHDGITNHIGSMNDTETYNEEQILSLIQTALNDCNEVLQMDSKCAQGYALRSQLQLMFGGSVDGNNMLELDCVDNNNINSSESAVLSAAAKDALAAYLVGGSTDLRSTNIP